MREAGIEKEENQEEYDEDIEVKPQLYDSLTRQQQKDFKELKTAFLKRDIELRDSLGAIEKFNINYDSLYSPQFQKVAEKLKSNFLLKECAVSPALMKRLKNIIQLILFSIDVENAALTLINIGFITFLNQVLKKQLLIIFAMKKDIQNTKQLKLMVEWE